MRSFLLALLLLIACSMARAAGLPILDVAAVPYLNPEVRASYERFLLINLPRAFALSATGATGRWGGGGTLAQARDKALATCAGQGATDCAIYAEDLTVVWPGRPHLDPPSAPGPLITGSGDAFVPDPRFIWRGPQTARGLFVWGHGKAPGNQDLSSDQPQSYGRVTYVRSTTPSSTWCASCWIRIRRPSAPARRNSLGEAS